MRAPPTHKYSVQMGGPLKAQCQEIFEPHFLLKDYPDTCLSSQRLRWHRVFVVINDADSVVNIYTDAEST